MRHVPVAFVLALAALSGCGGARSQGTQPPPGAAPGCEEAGAAEDARRCPAQGSHPTASGLGPTVPAGSAPGCERAGADREARCPNPGRDELPPPISGSVPEGAAPGLEGDDAADR